MKWSNVGSTNWQLWGQSLQSITAYDTYMGDLSDLDVSFVCNYRPGTDPTITNSPPQSPETGASQALQSPLTLPPEGVAISISCQHHSSASCLSPSLSSGGVSQKPPRQCNTDLGLHTQHTCGCPLCVLCCTVYKMNIHNFLAAWVSI